MWILSNDTDANDRIELTAETRTEAAEEALEKLGWNLLTDGKQNKTTPKLKVIVTVLGGVVDVETLPIGVDVDVYDYDVDGYDEDRIEKDKSGTNVVIIEFEGRKR